jgi:Fe-S-cluster-containing dehydrogenase component
MGKRLAVDIRKCTECRTCELKCSAAHFELFNANKSGVRVYPLWPELPSALVCRQCEDPACLPACPSEALVINEFGAVQVLYDECGGCRNCVDACVYDGIWLDPLSGVAIKCDTCNGQFLCVADCFAGALSVVE